MPPGANRAARAQIIAQSMPRLRASDALRNPSLPLGARDRQDRHLASLEMAADVKTLASQQPIHRHVKFLRETERGPDAALVSARLPFSVGEHGHAARFGRLLLGDSERDTRDAKAMHMPVGPSRS